MITVAVPSEQIYYNCENKELDWTFCRKFHKIRIVILEFYGHYFC